MSSFSAVRVRVCRHSRLHTLSVMRGTTRVRAPSQKADVALQQRPLLPLFIAKLRVQYARARRITVSAHWRSFDAACVHTHTCGLSGLCRGCLHSGSVKCTRIYPLQKEARARERSRGGARRSLNTRICSTWRPLTYARYVNATAVYVQLQ